MKPRMIGLVLCSLLCLISLPRQAASVTIIAEPAFGRYEVLRGDSLWRISARESVYGDHWQWPLLYEGNRGLIQNPDLIHPGWMLNFPLNPGAVQVAQAIAFAQRYGEASPIAEVGGVAAPMAEARGGAAPMVAGRLPLDGAKAEGRGGATPLQGRESMVGASSEEKPQRLLPFGNGGAMILKAGLLFFILMALTAIALIPMVLGFRIGKKEAPKQAMTAETPPLPAPTQEIHEEQEEEKKAA